jgi:ArsR family metal-binding transcriptional regulator
MEILKTFVVLIKDKRRLLHLFEGDIFITIYDESTIVGTHQIVKDKTPEEALELINETRGMCRLPKLTLDEILTV